MTGTPQLARLPLPSRQTVPFVGSLPTTPARQIAEFLTPLVMEDDSAGTVAMVLTAPLIFVSVVLGVTITVPAGFQTDLASIPRVLWNVLPPVGSYDRAAVLHDLAYAAGFCSRALADALLREAMGVCGTGPIDRWAIYVGVRLGGGTTWRRYRRGA